MKIYNVDDLILADSFGITSQKYHFIKQEKHNFPLD